MYEEALKNIENIFREGAFCSSELDHIEQTSWILFLKYLDEYEDENTILLTPANSISSNNIKLPKTLFI